MVRPVASVVAVDALPDNAAVIVPALKLPDESRATIVEPVFALVAFDVTVKVAVAEPLYVVDPDRPVPDVFSVKVLRLLPNVTPEIVDAASLETAIAAEALMSAFTIVPSAIIVLVTVPVSPLVITVPVVSGKVSVLLAPSVVGVKVTLKLEVPPARPISSTPSCVAAARVRMPDALVDVIEVKAPVVGVVAPTVPLMLMLAVPVRLVTVPDNGVPRAPPLTTKAPAVPVLTPSAVTTPLPVVVDVIAVLAPPPKSNALAARVPDCVTKPPVVLTALPTAVTTPVPVVVVAGDAPAPPPITNALEASAPEEAIVLDEE
jgi:hypothetical protein